MYGKVLHLVRDGGVPQKLVNVASDGAAAILWDRKEDPGEAGARLLRSLLRNCERVDEIPSMFLPPHLRPPEDPLECQMQEEEAPPPEAAAPVQEEVEVEEVEEVSPYVPGEDALARAGEARWDEEDEEEDEMMEKMLQEKHPTPPHSGLRRELRPKPRAKFWLTRCLSTKKILFSTKNAHRPICESHKPLNPKP